MQCHSSYYRNWVSEHDTYGIAWIPLRFGWGKDVHKERI